MEHLQELIDNKKFAGFVLRNEGSIIGAAFGFEKTWWNDTHIHIEDFFISPELQRMENGRAILSAIEKYAAEKGLSRIILLTDRKYPAFDFYIKNRFSHSENTVFMYKLL